MPKDILMSYSVLIEYKGKLASVVRHQPLSFRSFDLWILEDVKKGVWSKQTFDLSYDLVNMTSPGTNKAGEIIFAPTKLSHCAQPFYIFHYNTQKKDLRRVRIHGIADDEGFRRHYGLCWKLNAILEGMNSRTCLLNPLAVHNRLIESGFHDQGGAVRSTDFLNQTMASIT
ncbi:hypothetical protein F2Q70_00030495 [Brassica cretica]|uniref:F-box associated beta-propeller type 3 domain-containing protein n=1 Tax=Brassica cretica TaxID=69181 RepID=A0A8S9FSI2_BRACR|nr:hypothetical protein F2Q70_00030495 [Brassica cretica]